MSESKYDTVVRVLSLYVPAVEPGLIPTLAQEICAATGLDSGKLCRVCISVDSWGYGIECTLPEGHAGEVHSAGPFAYSGRHSR